MSDIRSRVEARAQKFYGEGASAFSIDVREQEAKKCIEDMLAILRETAAPTPEGLRDAPFKTFCPECGPNVNVDEEGLCVSCGATAIGAGLDRLNDRILALWKALADESGPRNTDSLDFQVSLWNAINEWATGGIETKMRAVVKVNTLIRAALQSPPVPAQESGLRCLFCGESDFDKVGLRAHLMVFGCKAFEETPTLDEAGRSPR